MHPQEDVLRETLPPEPDPAGVWSDLAGKKVGWFIEELRVGEHEGQAGPAPPANEAKFSVQFLGLKSETETHSTTAYWRDGDGEIIFASDQTTEDDSETQIFAKNGSQTGCWSQPRPEGKRLEVRVAVPKDTLGQTRMLDHWLEVERKQGDTFETYTASWDQRGCRHQGRRSLFRERSAILWGGVPTEVYRVEFEIQAAGRDDARSRRGGFWKASWAGCSICWPKRRTWRGVWTAKRSTS